MVRYRILTVLSIYLLYFTDSQSLWYPCTECHFNSSQSVWYLNGSQRLACKCPTLLSCKWLPKVLGLAALKRATSDSEGHRALLSEDKINLSARKFFLAISQQFIIVLQATYQNTINCNQNSLWQAGHTQYRQGKYPVKNFTRAGVVSNRELYVSRGSIQPRT